MSNISGGYHVFLRESYINNTKNTAFKPPYSTNLINCDWLLAVLICLQF